MNRSFCAVAGILLVAMSASMAAQRGRRGGANANLGVPVATNTILGNPDAYYGKQITISAGVARMVSKTAFLLDQWKAAGPHAVQPLGRPVLVVAPYLTNTLDHRNYLLVRGELIKFDTAAMARVAAEYKLDLGPDLWAEFHGQPMLLAASVVNSTFAELAKKPVLPPTTYELAMSEAMKTISPAFTALRAAADDAKADLVANRPRSCSPRFCERSLSGTISDRAQRANGRATRRIRWPRFSTRPRRAIGTRPSTPRQSSISSAPTATTRSATGRTTAASGSSPAPFRRLVRAK